MNIRLLNAFFIQKPADLKQLGLHERDHLVHEPILFFNLRALTLQLVFCLNQLVFLRKLGVDFGKLRLNPIDFRNILHPVHAPALHRRA